MSARVTSDIYLVGLGMFELRHLTLEAADILKGVAVVYHLSNKHSELVAINPRTESLDYLYSRPARRVVVYDEIATFVVQSAKKARPIALAVDGNPMFFSDISWKVAAAGSSEGLRVEAVPGVSCIDVLPSQLGFEPGDLGMQVYEASQLVIYALNVNPYVSTLLLQVGFFLHDITRAPLNRPPGTYTPLVEHLLKFFPPSQPAIFIQSAYSLESGSVVLSTEIASIDHHRNDITPGMTLYIPRVGVPPVDPAFRGYLAAAART